MSDVPMINAEFWSYIDQNSALINGLCGGAGRDGATVGAEVAFR